MALTNVSVDVKLFCFFAFVGLSHFRPVQTITRLWDVGWGGGIGVMGEMDVARTAEEGGDFRSASLPSG